MLTPYAKKTTKKNNIILCKLDSCNYYGVMLVVPKDKRTKKLEIYITYTNKEGLFYHFVKRTSRHTDQSTEYNLNIFNDIVVAAIKGTHDWRNDVKVSYNKVDKNRPKGLPSNPDYRTKNPPLDSRTLRKHDPYYDTISIDDNLNVDILKDGYWSVRGNNNGYDYRDKTGRSKVVQP